MQPYAKNMAVEFADKAIPGGEIAGSIKTLEDKTQSISHSADGTSVDGNLSAGVIYGSTSVSSQSGAFEALKCNTLSTDETEIVAQKPVVEDMTGYSLVSVSNLISNPYISVCKNGNKLTFAFSFEITLTEQPPYSQFVLADIIIPQSIKDKIVHYSRQGVDYVVCSGNYFAFSDLNSGPKTGNYFMFKANGIALELYTDNLLLNTSYLIRIEQTFLLSENLAE